MDAVASSIASNNLHVSVINERVKPVYISRTTGEQWKYMCKYKRPGIGVRMKSFIENTYMPMALLPPPTQATTRSGRRPILSKS